jgi:hypothetical protein
MMVDQLFLQLRCIITSSFFTTKGNNDNIVVNTVVVAFPANMHVLSIVRILETSVDLFGVELLLCMNMWRCCVCVLGERKRQERHTFSLVRGTRGVGHGVDGEGDVVRSKQW